MNLSDAKKNAMQIIGTDVCFPFRNVWGFFNDSDSDIQAVFITKDNSDTEVSGIFLDDGQESGFTEYTTKKVVPSNIVFGKTFFDDDPSLRNDSTPEGISVFDKIDLLLEESSKLLIDHGLPAGALVMLYGLADEDEEDEESILLRLTILKNYLVKTDKHISTEEFSFMHHELYTA